MNEGKISQRKEGERLTLQKPGRTYIQCSAVTSYISDLLRRSAFSVSATSWTENGERRNCSPQGLMDFLNLYSLSSFFQYSYIAFLFQTNRSIV